MLKVVVCALFLGAAGFISPLTQLAAEPGNGGALMPARVFQDAATSADEDSTTDSEAQPPTAFRTTVRHLFDVEKFDQLDEIAGEVRAQKSRFRGGDWKLHYFYGTLEEPGSLTAVDAAWEAHFERLQRWIASHPDSITPRVALAAAYLRFAWKARGSGYANKVVPEGWKAFKERVQKAQEVLEEARSLPAKDPEWHRAMQTVALAQGWDHKRAEQLLTEANSVEPGYYYFDEAYANYLLPKWYGKPGDAEEFARTVADRIGGVEGDSTYFKVALSLNCCRKQAEAPGISWDRVKEGFASLEQLYGSTNYERNALAFMALRQGDREFAQQLFARIGDNWNKRVWRSKDKFESGKASLNQGP
jgi:hypothetical protein